MWKHLNPEQTFWKPIKLIPISRWIFPKHSHALFWYIHKKLYHICASLSEFSNIQVSNILVLTWIQQLLNLWHTLVFGTLIFAKAANPLAHIILSQKEAFLRRQFLAVVNDLIFDTCIWQTAFPCPATGRKNTIEECIGYIQCFADWTRKTICSDALSWVKMPELLSNILKCPFLDESQYLPFFVNNSKHGSILLTKYLDFCDFKWIILILNFAQVNHTSVVNDYFGVSDIPSFLARISYLWNRDLLFLILLTLTISNLCLLLKLHLIRPLHLTK